MDWKESTGRMSAEREGHRAFAHLSDNERWIVLVIRDGNPNSDLVARLVADTKEGVAVAFEDWLAGPRTPVGLTPYKALSAGTSISECVKGRLYKIRARNFRLGVYDGNEGFIGLREKFGSVFLDTEYHYDQGPPHGTVTDIVDAGVNCLANIEVRMYLRDEDSVTGREIEKTPPPNPPWWRFVDTGETSDAIRATAISNMALYDWLTAQQRQLAEASVAEGPG